MTEDPGPGNLGGIFSILRVAMSGEQRVGPGKMALFHSARSCPPSPDVGHVTSVGSVSHKRVESAVLGKADSTPIPICPEKTKDKGVEGWGESFATRFHHPCGRI